MKVKQQVDEDLKKAMIARDELRKSTYRSIKAEITKKETEKGASELDDAGVIALISSMVKKREESAAAYSEAGREDLAGKERAEAELLKDYLPEQLSPDEIRTEVQKIIVLTQATGMKNMGKVVKAFKESLPNRAEGGLIAQIVKEELTKVSA